MFAGLLQPRQVIPELCSGVSDPMGEQTAASKHWACQRLDYMSYNMQCILIAA